MNKPCTNCGKPANAVKGHRVQYCKSCKNEGEVRFTISCEHHCQDKSGNIYLCPNPAKFENYLGKKLCGVHRRVSDQVAKLWKNPLCNIL